jgi:hypothetical protein
MAAKNRKFSRILTNRIYTRWVWALIIVVLAFLSYFINRYIQYNYPEYGCEQLRNDLIIITPIIISFGAIFIALFLPEDKQPSEDIALKIVPLFTFLFLLLGIPLLTDNFLELIDGCGGSELISCVNAQNELDKGNLSKAEVFAEQCLNDSYSPGEINNAEFLLSKVYISQIISGVDSNDCEKTEKYLQLVDEKDLLIPTHGGNIFVGEVNALSSLYDNICNIVVPTYEISFVGQAIAGDDVIIDIRVFADKDFRDGLRKRNFKVMNGNTEIGIASFDEKNENEPICIIPVVDNSNSVQPYLEELRESIVFLNQKSKPNDRLGIVVFGGEREHKLTNPGFPDLNPMMADGKGQTTAIFHAMDQAFEVAGRCAVDLRYLVIITDGQNKVPYISPDGIEHDNDSASLYFAERARAEGVRICTIGIQSSQLETRPLQLMETNCGGYFPASSADYIGEKFSEIINYERQFYRLKLDAADIVFADGLRIELYDDPDKLPVGTTIVDF